MENLRLAVVFTICGVQRVLQSDLPIHNPGKKDFIKMNSLLMFYVPVYGSSLT